MKAVPNYRRSLGNDWILIVLMFNTSQGFWDNVWTRQNVTNDLIVERYFHDPWDITIKWTCLPEKSRHGSSIKLCILALGLGYVQIRRPILGQSNQYCILCLYCVYEFFIILLCIPFLVLSVRECRMAIIFLLYFFCIFVKVCCSLYE